MTCLSKGGACMVPGHVGLLYGRGHARGYIVGKGGCGLECRCLQRQWSITLYPSRRRFEVCIGWPLLLS